jgi:Ala-tRNA(Pro) deacylase
MTAVEKIRQLLDENNISYEFKEHEEVRTSEEAARVRGEDIKIGAKAMLLKCDDNFIMFILSSALKIDSKRVKQITGTKSARFATPEEVMEHTGCLPGGVPPFANIFGLDFYVDRSIEQNEQMAFNAGERTKSIKMKTKDYIRLLSPKIDDFSIVS